MPNMKIGYLPQEPQLDPDKTVREEVESGMGEVMVAKAELERIYAAYAEPDADFDKLAEEQGRYEAIIAAAGSDTEHQLEIAADALRLPPWDAKIGPLSGGEKRRVALCKLLLSKPDMLLLDEPTNHLDAESVEWLEQFLQRYPGTVVGVTHDRYFLDNAAEWILELDRGHGHPVEGQLQLVARPEAGAAEGRGVERVGASEGVEDRARMGAPEPEGAAGEVEGAHRALRGTELAGIPEAQRDERDLHPGRRAARQRGHRVQGRHEGVRRPRADGRAVVQGSGRRDRRHHRPERRRQVDAVPHDRGPGEAGLRARS